MALRRGVAYRYPAKDPLIDSLLVVTNDEWNRTMSSVAVVPLVPADSPNPLQPKVVPFPPLMAVIPRFVGQIRKGDLADEIRQLEPAELEVVEDGFARWLSLAELCREAPALPNSPAGEINYPRWGEVYYAGDPVGGETKRYVVVTSDEWNQGTAKNDKKRVMAVRLTSKGKSGAAFPALAGANAQACCGDAVAWPIGEFDLKGRPDPPRLGLPDMVSVAWGLVDAFALGGALQRLGLPRYKPT